MSNLINRKALMEHIESEYRQWGEDYDAEQILGDIEDFPTAFDVDKVIAELKDKQDLFAEESKTDAHAENVRNEFRGQSFAYGESIKIIKKHLSGTAEPPKTD